jgi:hypothetical protein
VFDTSENNVVDVTLRERLFVLSVAYVPIKQILIFRKLLFYLRPLVPLKVRYYGFLHPGSSIPLEKIVALIELAFGFEIVTPKTVLEPPEPMICTNCGKSLVFRASLLPCKIVSADSG